MRYWQRALAAVLLVVALPVSIVMGTAGAATACSTTTGHTTCTETVTADLEAGSYTIEAPSSLSWQTVSLTGFTQTKKATLSITIKNGSGATSGWQVDATMTTLKTAGGSKLPDTAVSLNGSSSSATASTAPTAACATGSTCVLPTNSVTYPFTVPAATTAPTASACVSAADTTGLGAATVPLDAWLHVPGDAKAGTYSATITLSIVSGP